MRMGFRGARAVLKVASLGLALVFSIAPSSVMAASSSSMSGEQVFLVTITPDSEVSAQEASQLIRSNISWPSQVFTTTLDSKMQRAFFANLTQSDWSKLTYTPGIQFISEVTSDEKIPNTTLFLAYDKLSYDVVAKHLQEETGSLPIYAGADAYNPSSLAFIVQGSGASSLILPTSMIRTGFALESPAGLSNAAAQTFDSIKVIIGLVADDIPNKKDFLTRSIQLAGIPADKFENGCVFSGGGSSQNFSEGMVSKYGTSATMSKESDCPELRVGHYIGATLTLSEVSKIISDPLVFSVQFITADASTALGKKNYTEEMVKGMSSILCVELLPPSPGSCQFQRMGGIDSLQSEVSRFPTERNTYRGSGVNIGIFDNDISSSQHPDIAGRVQIIRPSVGSTTSAMQQHGHMVASVLASNGLGLNANAKGVMDSANVKFASSYVNAYSIANWGASVNSFVTTAEVPVLAKPQGKSIQGPANYPGFESDRTPYTSWSGLIDDELWRMNSSGSPGLLVVQAAGNVGGTPTAPLIGRIHEDANAKNVLVVGGVNHSGDLSPQNDVFWIADSLLCPGGGSGCIWRLPAGVSSHGSSYDGRLLPLISDYASGFHVSYTSTAYRTFHGTSMASSAVAAKAAAIVAMWKYGHFGPDNPASSASVFAARPAFTTTKALLVNTANDFESEARTELRMDRGKQGWGMVDLDSAALQGASFRVVNETRNLAQGQSFILNINIPSTSRPGKLKATLTWRDPPAVLVGGQWASPSAPALVNDFDLKVISPGGQTVYYGNLGTLTGPWSTSSPVSAPAQYDRVNILENVFIANPVPGTWRVQVIANRIARDVVESSASVFDSPFALVVSTTSGMIAGMATSGDPARTSVKDPVQDVYDPRLEIREVPARGVRTINKLRDLE